MANEMLTGLLNQTSGGNWWGGSGAPTSGYGSFTPTPPPPQQAAPTTPGASQPAQLPSSGPTSMLPQRAENLYPVTGSYPTSISGGAGGVSWTVGQPQPQQQQPQGNPNQWKMDLVAQNVGDRMGMFQAELDQLRVAQASYPQGSDRWNKYQMQIQQKMVQMQAEQNRMGGVR